MTALAQAADGRSIAAFVALGSNLGDASDTVHAALSALSRLPQTRLVRFSSLYRTAPWEANGPDFINAVAELDTTLDAHTLLAELQALEQLAGRERPYRNAPRTLDLDILLFGEADIHTDTLQVPHPRMWERAFVLIPLAEIAPELVPAEALQAVKEQVIDLL